MMFSNIVFTLCVVQTAYAARILASICTPSYSHQVAFRPIWKELAKRGHEIVLLTTDPMEYVENIRQIDLSFTYEAMKERNYSSLITNQVQDSPVRLMTIVADILFDLIFRQVEHQEVHQLMNNKSEHFDLLMIELMFPVHLGLVEKFKVPVIALTSMEAPHDLHSIMGNGVHTVLYPESILLSQTFPLTLWQRIFSTIGLLVIRAFNKYYILPPIMKRMQDTFGETCRPFEELFKDVDMMFINTNPVLHHIRSLAPNTITFGGGFHVEPITKPLPKDLREFLDTAPFGVVYFSLGTNVKSNLLNDKLKQVFLDAFAELPYKVLWKFEDENIVLKSDNIMIRKWVPQSDILAHPNIKLFITQCGLQSTEEAIMNHVPMVGLPFIGDQPANAHVLQKKGLAIHLDHSTLTSQIFKEAITEVITNIKYKETVVDVAELMTDVEMTGLEKVVWWTEYVIRNKGAKHLKIPILDTPFYQYYLLDVFLLLGGIICIWFFCMKKMLSTIIRFLSMKKKQD